MLSVLIADDEWIEREGISLLLERSPYEFQVYMAENGEEAMKCLEKNTVDILFTDIKMPFMDGLELLVQANQTYKGLKIVIFSAFADFDYAKTALENRVIHYFLKPIDPDEFQKGRRRNGLLSCWREAKPSGCSFTIYRMKTKRPLPPFTRG